MCPFCGSDDLRMVHHAHAPERDCPDEDRACHTVCWNCDGGLCEHC